MVRTPPLTAGAQGQSLVRVLRPHKPQAAAKKKKVLFNSDNT